MNTKTFIKKPLTAAVIMAALPFSAANAEEFMLEEIIVTAQKRAQSLQDVPISVSALSGDKIADVGIQRFEDAATYVPNFTITKEPIGDKISIRGIASGNNAGFEQSVGTFVDGIYRGRNVQSRFAFLDVGMLEVLRGPQGTLFGKNTVAGALNITSAKPTEEFEGQIKARHNVNLDETEFTGYVSGALSDKVRGRFAFMQREMDEGWVENEFYDHEGSQSDEWAGRVSLEWDASEDTLVSFKYEHGDWDLDGAAVEIGNAGPLAAMGISSKVDGKVSYGQTDPVLDFGSVSLFEGDLDEYALTIDHKVEGATITAIAGYSEYEFERKQDVDYNPLSIAGLQEDEEFEQKSLELRIVSDTGSDFEYIAGVYWQDADMTTDALSQISIPDVYTLTAGGCGIATIATSTSAAQAAACAQQGQVDFITGGGAAIGDFSALPGVGRYAALEQNTETWAAFTQVTWNIQDDLRATLGIRYTEEEKEAEQSVMAADYAKDNRTVPAAGGQAIASSAFFEFTPHSFTEDDLSRDEESLTWSLNVQYDIFEDVMAYVSASTGFKAGGFNSFYMGQAAGAGADPLDAEFEEEEVLTYEIGSKMVLLDGTAELNVAYFYTEYDDLQVSIFSGNTTFEVQNAAEATTQGIELDGRWQVSENLMLSGALGWIDFEYKSFENQACTAEQFLAYRESVYQATGGAGVGNILSNNGDCAAAGINNLEGRESAFSPEYSATLSADYTQALGDFTIDYGVDVTWRDEMYVQEDLDPFLISDSITKVNAMIRLSPADGNWEVSLIGNNITNETNEVNWGNDMPLAPTARIVTTTPGATYAISGALKF